MFNSPNTAAMMGTVPVERRGIAAGARVMLQNTGAVISIAFVMAIVTAAVPTTILFKIFSGLASGLTNAQLAPFISNMHSALWVLAAVSLAVAGNTSLKLTADKTKLAYNKKTLKAKAGKVTITMVNTSSIFQHDVAVKGKGIKTKKGKTVGKNGISKVTYKSRPPGGYTFYCTVPGHEAAGMKGKLVVTK